MGQNENFKFRIFNIQKICKIESSSKKRNNIKTSSCLNINKYNNENFDERNFSTNSFNNNSNNIQRKSSINISDRNKINIINICNKEKNFLRNYFFDTSSSHEIISKNIIEDKKSKFEQNNGNKNSEKYNM